MHERLKTYLKLQEAKAAEPISKFHKAILLGFVFSNNLLITNASGPAGLKMVGTLAEFEALEALLVGDQLITGTSVRHAKTQLARTYSEEGTSRVLQPMATLLLSAPATPGQWAEGYLLIRYCSFPANRKRSSKAPL